MASGVCPPPLHLVQAPGGQAGGRKARVYSLLPTGMGVSEGPGGGCLWGQDGARGGGGCAGQGTCVAGHQVSECSMLMGGGHGQGGGDGGRQGAWAARETHGGQDGAVPAPSKQCPSITEQMQEAWPGPWALPFSPIHPAPYATSTLGAGDERGDPAQGGTLPAGGSLVQSRHRPAAGRPLCSASAPSPCSPGRGWTCHACLVPVALTARTRAARLCRAPAWPCPALGQAMQVPSGCAARARQPARAVL